MDQELQKALAAILQKATSGVEAGVVFLQNQLPEVIHQLLMWKAVESGVFFIFSLIATPILWLMAVRIYKSDDDWREGLGNPLAMFPALASIFAFLGVLTHLDWLQILIAPKIYLIEYAASLAK